MNTSRAFTVVRLAALVAGCAQETGAVPAPVVAAPPILAADPRDGNIEKMARLLRATDDDDPQKPDFHFRMAELCAERWYHPSVGERDPQRWHARALESYQAAARFPQYTRADEVLFKMGCLLQSNGQEAPAREAFDRLIKEHPGSPLVAEAWGRRR